MEVRRRFKAREAVGMETSEMAEDNGRDEGGGVRSKRWGSDRHGV